MKKQWTWIMILCVFNFTLMGFILTHPTSKNQDAKIVEKEEKKSFTFVGVGDNLYQIHNICVKNKMNTIILILIMK